MASPLRSLLLAAALSLPAVVGAGKIYTSPALVTKKYDFIVVGAGVGGSTVAARLSEKASVNVLLIEAGGLDNATSVFETIYVPLMAGTGSGGELDWQYTTAPQAGLNGRTLPYPRGKVLGGSSAINGMIYWRGSADEYNRIATVSGESGWKWSNLKSYMLKNEKHTAPWNNRFNVGEYDPAWHGSGPLLTGLTPEPFELDKRVVATAKANATFNLDVNSGNGVGVTWLGTTVGNGMRSTAASAYLHPAVNARSNFDILINTQATKLVQTASKTFRGVTVAQSASGKAYTLTATKEVILSAGSIGTPQLLMLSGIGPRSQLSSLGISTVLDVPDVGKNLQDQTILALQWQVNSGIETLSSFLSNATAFGLAISDWETNGHTGFAAGNTVVNTISYSRLPSSAPILKTIGTDPAAGPTSPHFQLAFMNFFYPNPGQTTPAGNYNSICIVLASPTSRGSLNITSSSAFTYPSINPNILTTDFDIKATIAGARAAAGILRLPAAALASDAALEAYIRKYTNSLEHPTSTARISKNSDKTGVVGPRLLVKGVTGLRVVDASVLPAAPASFPQGEIYVLAERAADFIKEAWNL
ncbi:Aryl-alcohol oxidase-like protein [Mycena kentingensis (nom. inval.)]|nr:Aryl-alcohol oxidase-like protein [Mycena kentingensis (nom. inval.)]